MEEKIGSDVTVREAAIKLGCTLKFVYDLLYAGRLAGAAKVGRTWRIPVSTVEARIRSCGGRQQLDISRRRRGPGEQTYAGGVGARLVRRNRS